MSLYGFPSTISNWLSPRAREATIGSPMTCDCCEARVSTCLFRPGHPQKLEELGLKDEADCCRHCGIEFLSFPIEDRSVPTNPSFDTFLRNVNEHLTKGERVAVHCRAGIGRSAIIVACLLMRNGLSAEAAFAAIQKARAIPVPDTPEQRRWVEEYSRTQKQPR